MNHPPVTADIGVIGGSGLYALLDGATERGEATDLPPELREQLRSLGYLR